MYTSSMRACYDYAGLGGWGHQEDMLVQNMSDVATYLVFWDGVVGAGRPWLPPPLILAVGLRVGFEQLQNLLQPPRRRLGCLLSRHLPLPTPVHHILPISNQLLPQAHAVHVHLQIAEVSVTFFRLRTLTWLQFCARFSASWPLGQPPLALG